ncbi:hypothetical protein M673_06035 [Aureimonas sp. AU20]|nr:hypothetical protein M673_06035 [Aureimonas sp. AU20]
MSDRPVIEVLEIVISKLFFHTVRMQYEGWLHKLSLLCRGSAQPGLR